jgi:hypothetical protein
VVLVEAIFSHNREGRFDKLFAGMLAFSVIVVIISALITTRRDKMDGAEIATYVVIIAWGSLVWGLFLSKCAR